ncbi:MAG: hypothetical protein ACE37I_12020, partial [Rubinisphaera brasiliensis]|uniref:hypothetical protein n=1 Tax=Rubinisphaera brasiliensis TaxID=119 RepID=UPI00391BEC4A
MPARRRTLRKDPKGYFRPYIGVRIDGKPQRFNLGRDETEAERRFHRISQLWEESCRVMKDERWQPFALAAAKWLAKGVFTIRFDFPDYLSNQEDPAAEYAEQLHVFQQQFPSLHIVPTKQDVYEWGCGECRFAITDELADLSASARTLGFVKEQDAVPDRLISGSLHEAIEGYIAHIEATASREDENLLKSSQRKRIQYARTLKEHHENRPLYELTFDEIAKKIGYWTNRPLTKRGTRYKPNAVRHPLKEFERFLRWLDATTQFDWQMPRGVDQISRKITELEEDQEQAGIITKPVYSPEELGILVRHANDFDRMLIYVGVNCAFGAAEIGRLKVNEVLVHHTHEFAERLHFETTSQDSFIRLNRHKSKMFGEWLLWPQTVNSLKWGVDRAKRLGSRFVVVRESGNKLYDERTENAQAGFANRWRKLIDRVQKSHSDFPRLPYGTLRDILPDILRHRYADEIASISLAHKTAYKPDTLLEAYG